jgi:hypothetical protein
MTLKRTPTDIEILDRIYNNYYEEFKSFSKDKPNRQTKILVPIDILKIANDLKVDEDIIFGRLYYYFENKFGYKQDDGSSVHFFSLSVGTEIHCINFPYMASVLADMRDEKRKYRTSTGLAILSLIISIVSIYLSIMLK